MILIKRKKISLSSEAETRGQDRENEQVLCNAPKRINYESLIRLRAQQQTETTCQTVWKTEESCCQ